MNQKPKSTTPENQPWALVCLFLVLCSCCFAEKVGWHDQMSLHAGDGVDLKNQQEARARTVVLMGSEAIPDPNTGDASETVTFAQHAFDLVSSLSVNANVTLRTTSFEGNAGVGFIKNHKFSGNSLEFVFTATRNFGDAYFPINGGFSSDFNSEVSKLRQAYSGLALHQEITKMFGTHVVAGRRSAAMVSVIFSFDYGSASLAQQLAASARGNWGWGNFSSHVDSFFKSKDTRRTLSYEFYSTDPNQSPTNFNFASTGSITNYEGFARFVTLVEAYWRAMNPENAKVTGYILEPLKNMPGYLSLIGGSTPPSVISADYGGFLEAFASLQAWRDRLTDWTINPRKMSWLNATGQRLVLAKRQDVVEFVAVMERIAINHLSNGTPLQVPADVFNYLNTLSDIPIPAIYVPWASDDTVYPNQHQVLGWVDCGSKSNTVSVPFLNVSEQLDGTDVGWATSLAYTYQDVTNLVQRLISFWSTRTGSSSIVGDLRAFLASSAWASLTNAAFSSRRIGFFGDSRAKAEKTNTFMMISDAEGNIVDQLNWMSTRGGSIPETTSTAEVSVSASAPQLVQGTVGLAETIPLTVTNSGSTPAHGINASFQLDSRFEFAGSIGSQGYVEFNPSNRMVSCNVGPLAPGAHAEVGFRVIPLQAGLLPSAGNITLSVGDLLTNNPTPQIELAQTSADSPLISLVKIPSGLELSWFSDTDRLKVEQSPHLGLDASWSVLTNAPVALGSKRILTLHADLGSLFYRLITL